MKKRGIIISVCVLLWSSLFFLPAWAELTVKEVEENIMCMCKDKCGKVLSNCICQYSDQYRMDISIKLKEGLTKDQVIQTYIDKYGEKVLSSPTKKVFNLAAWITPFFAIMIGGVGIRRVVVKWVSSRENEKKEKALEEATPIDSKYSSLLEQELKDFD